MNKYIFVDTETTGISRKTERLLEVACIEVIDRKVTGRQLHQYINPEKAVEEGAFRVHGISWEKVKHEPVFADVADAIIDMLKDRIFVAHNAPFDMGFLNEEFKRAGYDFQIGRDVEVMDTLVLAKKIYPGQKNSLDVLCNRLSIDRSSRVLHGALLDTQLLIQVYIAMTQKQERFLYAKDKAVAAVSENLYHQVSITEEEASMHNKYMEVIQ